LKAYIANGEEKLAEARRMRDEAVRLLRQKHTHTEVSEMTGLSVAMVRIITRGVSRGTE